MIDITHQMNRTRRSVGDRVLEVGEAHVVTIGQAYPTDAADLWDALLQMPRHTERLQTQLIAPLAARIADERQRKEAEAAATKVEFFTMVRGE